MLGNSEANSYEEEALGQIPSNLFLVHFPSAHRTENKNLSTDTSEVIILFENALKIHKIAGRM